MGVIRTGRCVFSVKEMLTEKKRIVEENRSQPRYRLRHLIQPTLIGGVYVQTKLRTDRAVRPYQGIV